MSLPYRYITASHLICEAISYLVFCKLLWYGVCLCNLEIPWGYLAKYIYIVYIVPSAYMMRSWWWWRPYSITLPTEITANSTGPIL